MTAGTPPLPAGTTLYRCPLCEWVHAMPPVTLDCAVGNLDALTVLRGQMVPVEAAVEAHLAAHPLIEWVRAVTAQRTILAAYRKVYDHGDQAILHLAGCGRCDPVGYDHDLCDRYFAACRDDGERARQESGQVPP